MKTSRFFFKFLPASLLLLTCILYPAYSQKESTVSQGIIKNCEIKEQFYKGIICVYHFEFRTADNISTKLILDYPTSSWGHVLAANILWWKLITGENNQLIKSDFFKELEICDKLLKYSDIDEGLYCQIITNSLRSRYELLNKNYFAILRLLNKSRKIIQQSEGKEVKFEPFLLTQGLFQYFIAAGKEKTGYFSYLIQYKSDKQKGLDYLNSLTSSNDKVLRTESNYFLMKIYLEIEKDPVKAKPYADYLLIWFPENQLFCFYNTKVNSMIYGKHKGITGLSPCSNFKAEEGQLSENQINYLNSLSAQNN